MFHVTNLASVTSADMRSSSDLNQVGSVLLAGCFASIKQPQLPCHLLLDKFFSLMKCIGYLYVMGWQCIVSWLNMWMASANMQLLSYCMYNEHQSIIQSVSKIFVFVCSFSYEPGYFYYNTYYCYCFLMVKKLLELFK